MIHSAIRDCGLAEWIIGDSCLVIFIFRYYGNYSYLNVNLELVCVRQPALGQDVLAVALEGEQFTVEALEVRVAPSGTSG